MNASQLIDLVIKSRQPVYIVRGANTNPGRVLLVYDGTESSARVIRTFLAQKPIKYAHCRLLGVGSVGNEKPKNLESMREYCEAWQSGLEVGRLAGSLRKVFIPYAEKWAPDVVVMGISRTLGLFTRLRGCVVLDVLKRTKFDLYLMG